LKCFKSGIFEGWKDLRGPFHAVRSVNALG
jgi:hypothetical protein